MSELDEAWELALAEAQQKARAAGRRDIEDYLALRAANDLMRQTSVAWLLSTFTQCAGQANRAGADVQISTQTAHRFAVGRSTMVGSLLTLASGVRTLTVAAGWPRTPRDGFVRGGGLAFGQIRHLGRKSADRELLLLKSRSGVPQWVMLDKAGERSLLQETEIRNHLALLTAQ